LANKLILVSPRQNRSCSCCPVRIQIL